MTRVGPYQGQTEPCAASGHRADCPKRAFEFYITVPYAREVRLFLEVDRFHIAHAAIAALAAEGNMTAKDVASAIKKYRLDV